MSGDGKVEMLSGRVPSELKERVRQDPRPNQQVMKEALEREFATEDEAAVLNRLDEINREMETLREQKERREQKLSQKEEEKERLFAVYFLGVGMRPFP